MADKRFGPALKAYLRACDLPLPHKDDIVRMEQTLEQVSSPTLVAYLRNQKVKATKAKTKIKGKGKETNEEFLNLIEELRIVEYFDGDDKVFPKAMRILERPEIRLPVETMMMTWATDRSISEMIFQRYRVTIEEDALKMYRKYFYQTKFMDNRSWLYYLRGRPPYECSVKTRALKDPEDVVGIRWSLGFRVDVNFKDMLKKAAHDAFFHYNNAMRSTFPDLDRANGFNLMFMRASDRVQKLSDGDKDPEGNVVFEIEGEEVKILKSKMVSGNLPTIGDQKKLVVLPPNKKANEGRD